MSRPVEHRLFALEAEPVRLAIPASAGEDPAAVFETLPRGIYEALRTFDHVRFVGLEEHLDRAERSMARFGLSGPLGRDALKHAIHAIVSDFPAPDTRLRFDVLAGPATILGTESRVLVLASTLELPPPVTYERGVRVKLAGDGLRRRRPEVKEAQWVLDRRAARGGTPDNFEPILVDGRGRLLEGVMSNFFAVRAGSLHTAPVEGVLPGVTRRIVLDLAAALSIPAAEEAVSRTELDSVDEAFFSTSIRSIVPIVEIAGVSLGDGTPGPLTRRLMAAYAEHCAAVARPAV